MPCVSQGQINLFELEREYYSSGYNPNLGFSPSYTKKINTYYNVGLGNLKLADYDNLSIDLADNLEAMSHLQRFKKQTNIQVGLYVGGGLLVAGSFIYFLDNQDFSITETVLSVSGAIAISIGYYISLEKQNHLREAVDVYNAF